MTEHADTRPSSPDALELPVTELRTALEQRSTEVWSVFESLRVHMREIVLHTHSLDLRAFELRSCEAVARELRPSVLGLTQRAMETLELTMAACDQIEVSDGDDVPERDVRTSFLPFEWAVDVAVATHSSSVRVIEEVAFMAQLELRQREIRLARAKASMGVMSLLSDADSAVRRVRKALTAVESAIARAGDRQPLLEYASETQISIGVRRAYARFRAGIRPDERPSTEDLHTRLRAAGIQIAMLVGWRAYPDMRIRDRLALRDIQQRIIDWLLLQQSTAPKLPADPRAGLRLWQDLVSCVEMFSLINRRAELLEHDVNTVQAVRAELTGRSGPVATAPRRRLESLIGLDPGLDRLLCDRETVDAASCVEILERLEGELAPPPW